jgi:HSP20 family molecular chaperone IbpA
MVPNTDIRQTRLAYHIEIEVPGTTNKDDLLIQWLSPSTMIVRGNIERPLVGHGKAAEGAYQWQQSEERGDGYPVGNAVTAAQDSTSKETTQSPSQSSAGTKQLDPKTADDGGPLKRMDEDTGDESADIPLFLLEERKTGPWQRTFTLPHNVEMKALRAKLDGGLLRIEIPIKDANEKPGIKIDIE